MTRKFTFLMTAMALILAIMGPRNVAWGQTTTYTMQSYSNNVITSDNNATWATSSACGGSELPYALNSKRGAGFQADNTVTSSISVTNASKITVIASSNGNKTTTLAVKVGNTTFGNTVSVPQQNYQTLEFTAPNNTPVSGTIVFTITRSSKTLWIGQVIVETATPSTDPTITCANITDVPYQGVNNATATVTFNNADGWTPSVTCDGTIVTTASLSENTVTYSVSENTSNADRTGSFTITLSKEGENNITKVVSVTQKHFVIDYAELPFYYDGGKDDLPDGLTQNGLDSDYSSSPKMKFNSTGDYVILKINETPGILNYTIKGNSFSGGTFKLQTSVDGETYTDKKTYTALGDATTETITDLDASVRYIKWIYTNKSNGNVALGDINLAKEGVKIPTFSIEGGNYWANQSVALSQADSKPIYYTTNDNDPTTNGTLYSEAISVTSTCTIKAAAQDGTEWSDVVSATYKIAQTYTTAASVNALTEDNIPVIVSMDNWTIKSINGNSMNVNDGTSSLQIYDYNIPETYAVGGKLSGSLKAVWTIQYNGEVKNIQNWSDINYSAPTFVIEIDDEIENGTIEATPTTATAGTEISFSVTPDEGYRMTAESLIVMDATGEEVEISGNNPYTFIMPASDVTISAEFELIPTTTYSYLYSINGVSENETDVLEGTVISLVTCEDLNDDFTFAGWTIDESNVDNIFTAGTNYTINEDVIFYAVYAREESGETTTPDAYTAGEEGSFVIATLVEGIYYAIPTNPTVNSGKIIGVEIQTESSNNVTYVSAENANGYTWTIADATYGQTLYDGNKYLYHSNGGNSGTNLTYGNSTSYTWSIISEDNGLSFQAMNSETVKDRGLLYQMGTANVFGGYSLSNEDKDDYSRIVVLPIATNSGATHYYTRVFLHETATANITIGGPSIIPAGSTLNMGTNTLVNENAANLVIEDGGQIIRSDEGTVNATFKKHIEGYTANQDNYYLIAAPIANASIEGLTTNSYDLYSYDEPTHYWFNQEGTNTFSSLSLGQGYLYANSTTGDVTISGTISNNQNPTIDVTASSDNLTGFNLVGNPFSYNLSISDMAMMDDDTEIYDITSIYQISGTAVVASQNTSVAPCEGFFIQAPVAGELYFNAGSSRSEKSSVSDLKVEVKEANRSAQLLDRAYVNFSESRPMNKFYLNENSTRLYIPQNGKDYAVVMANAAEGEMPVNFKAEKNGTYTITVSTENVEANYLHLIDNLTGADIDLLTTDSYTFDATTRDYASRFKLVFGVNNSNAEVNGNSFAYISNGELIISNEGRATLQVIDMTGRIVSSQEIEGEGHISTEGMTAGMYVLNLNGTTQKIVVR